MNIKQVLRAVWNNEGAQWRYVPRAYSSRGPGWGVFDRKEGKFIEDRKLLSIDPTERLLSVMIMVERMARAIDPYAFSDVSDSYDAELAAFLRSLRGQRKDAAMRMALAALRAMREPTDAMWSAGNDQAEVGINQIWRAMIDAAISEGSER